MTNAAAVLGTDKLGRQRIFSSKPSDVNTAFFGTPPIAVAALQALNEITNVVGVVCQPDRPAGRGLKLQPCAIKQAALELGLEVHQPRKVKTGTLHEWLAERRVEAVVVMAYGRILPPAVLTSPRLGCINLHASLLPKYRGAAPINWAIMRGETHTGISLMQMEEGLDTGPVFAQRSIPISAEMNAGELAQQMSALAAECVRLDLPSVFKGATPTAQDHSAATHAPPILREHCEVDWAQPAEQIHNQVRGLAPRPSAFSWAGDKRLKLLRTSASDWARDEAASPGRVIVCQKGLILVQTGSRPLQVHEAQLEGRKALDADQLINGRALTTGQQLGAPAQDGARDG